jgi:hypothetical protein
LRCPRSNAHRPYSCRRSDFAANENSVRLINKIKDNGEKGDDNWTTYSVNAGGMNVPFAPMRMSMRS